jgi:hypothetical protein
VRWAWVGGEGQGMRLDSKPYARVPATNEK